MESWFTSNGKLTLEGYVPKIIEFGIKVITAIIILFIGRYVIRILAKILYKFFIKIGVDKSINKFLVSLCKTVLYFLLIIIVCNIVGIETTSFIAVLGTGGVAIGLAMQGALSNLAGGVTILWVKPFVVGDYIIEEMNNGVEGTVSRIDLFYTSLTTVDNKVILIPNGTLTNSRIVNVTTNNKRRVDFCVGISYKSNIGTAKEVMWSVIEEYQPIIKDEERDVFVKALEQSQVTMQASVWVVTEQYGDALHYLNETMKSRLEEAGIILTYNQLDVHIIENNK